MENPTEKGFLTSRYKSSSLPPRPQDSQGHKCEVLGTGMNPFLKMACHLGGDEPASLTSSKPLDIRSRTPSNHGRICCSIPRNKGEEEEEEEDMPEKN